MAGREARARRGSPARALLWLMITLPIAGCASFKSSKRLDVSPFAQNTVGLIGEVQRATKPVQWVYLQKYQDLPSVQEVRRAARPAQTLMRGVALYSTQIVSIYESPVPDSRRVSELARYLDESIRERLKQSPAAETFLSQAELDAAVSNCKAASNFLAALGAAQPVVSAALAYGNCLYDSLEIRIAAADVDISARIETEFGPIKTQMDQLENLQLQNIRAYTKLAEYRQGSEASLDSLRTLDPESADAIPAGKKPAIAALDASDKRLLERIEALGTLHDRLNHQFEIYSAEQQELDALRTQANEAARLGRITLILWARSHSNLAAGITVPAQIDVMSMVKSAAGQAKSLVP